MNHNKFIQFKTYFLVHGAGCALAESPCEHRYLDCTWTSESASGL